MPTISGTVYDDTGAPAAGRTVRLYRRDTGELLGSTVTSDGVTPIVRDAYFSNVSLLLHFNGANGSTTFTDTSGTPKTPTVAGDAKISTAQSKFGGASGIFDGTGDYVDFAGFSALGTGDFTAEAFVRVASASSFLTVLDTRVGGATGVALYVGGSGLSMSLANNSTVTISPSSSLAPINVFYHLAIARESGTIRAFVGGALVGSVSDTRSLTGNTIRVGTSSSGSQGFAGHIDELRITAGVARYTANFTPPIEPFPDVGTVAALPTGAYSMQTDYTGEVQRVVLDDAAGTLYNDLVDRVVLA